jgi:hypothetical protein
LELSLVDVGAQKHFQLEPFENARALLELEPAQVWPSVVMAVESVTYMITPGNDEAKGSVPTVAASSLIGTLNVFSEEDNVSSGVSVDGFPTLAIYEEIETGAPKANWPSV